MAAGGDVHERLPAVQNDVKGSSKLIDECRNVLQRLGFLQSDVSPHSSLDSPVKGKKGTPKRSAAKSRDQATGLQRCESSPGDCRAEDSCDSLQMRHSAGAAEQSVLSASAAAQAAPGMQEERPPAQGALPAAAAAWPVAALGDARRSSTGSSWGSPRSSNRGSTAGGNFEVALLAINEQISDNPFLPQPSSSRRSTRPTGVPRLNLPHVPAPTPVPATHHGDLPAAARPLACRLTRTTSGPSARGGLPPHCSTSGDGGASGAGTAHGCEEQEGADLEAELESWSRPPTWVPTSEGRSFVYRPVSSTDVQRVEALLSRLPADVVGEVGSLWSALQQARHSCELMAARGVRVAKDVTSEWVEMSSGLMERMEDYESQIMELRQYISVQRAAVAHAGGRTTFDDDAAAASSRASRPRHAVQPRSSSHGGGGAAAPGATWGAPPEAAAWQEMSAANAELQDKLDSSRAMLQEADVERVALRRQQMDLIDAHCDVVEERDELAAELSAARIQLDIAWRHIAGGSGNGVVVHVERVPPASAPAHRGSRSPPHSPHLASRHQRPGGSCQRMVAGLMHSAAASPLWPGPPLVSPGPTPSTAGGGGGGEPTTPTRRTMRQSRTSLADLMEGAAGSGQSQDEGTGRRVGRRMGSRLLDSMSSISSDSEFGDC